ncbi:YdcF family protein [Edaphobacter albus]|uniref:YdcF family protein n=1 Tax=Edaphobacter sp. 4G125 TaxID=2763071 RepID=UPI001646497B|nr:YdcF family protein [Edaphobacter sp. 4G125]QNI35252.1 YdcF family protein [Edaphobacter sp. 4G125]
MKLFRQALFTLFLAVWVFLLVLYGNFFTLPQHNTTATHFDAIVVLGTPSKLDGTPSPEQRERVLEGVREYKAGIAPRIIMTGGAAHNHFVEAHSMAQFAASQGVPPSAIVEEDRSQNTIQNIFYSAQIMHQQGWSSAEVVSSPYHLGRTELILLAFNKRQPALSIDWRTHPSKWPPEYAIYHKIILNTVEAWRCLQLRFLSFPSSRFLPAHA